MQIETIEMRIDRLERAVKQLADAHTHHVLNQHAGALADPALWGIEWKHALGEIYQKWSTNVVAARSNYHDHRE